MVVPRSDPDDAQQHPNDPPAQDVTAQLDTILSSPAFIQSGRLQKLLRFITDETLAGRASRLSEYTVAFEVFERDETFDPQASSIVRVEASRLRTKLKEYYARDGRKDPVRISLPTGGYVPTFHTVKLAVAPGDVEPAPVRIKKFLSARAVAVIGVLVLIIGASTLLLLRIVDTKPAGDAPSASIGPDQGYSIAVLPLRNLSGKPDNDYFSDGMTNALIAGLAKQDAVRVISFTSVMAYKNVNRPITEIARKLNVNHVIEGAVLRSGDRVRITAQLIEAATDRHIWAESYERDVADVLTVQDDVARRIMASLSRKVAAFSGVGSKGKPAVDRAAQEAYLKGLFFRNKMTEEGFRKGVAYFQQAIDKAPALAEAYSGMASCYCLLGGFGLELVEPNTAMPSAKAAVLEALKLNDSLAEAHAFLGVIRLKYEWDWAGAEKAFKRSIQLNPSYAQARLFYSFYLAAMGRRDEAIREAAAARVIDPLSLQANLNLGWQYLRSGRHEQARRYFQNTAELDKNFWGAHWGMGHYYRIIGANGAAIKAFQKAIDAGGGHTLPLTDLGYTYAISGKQAEARTVLGKLETLAKARYVSPYNMATIHVGLGENDAAIDWLEKAFAERSRSMAWLNVIKEFDGLRSHPRFKSLIQRIGLPD